MPQKPLASVLTQDELGDNILDGTGRGQSLGQGLGLLLWLFVLFSFIFYWSIVDLA